MKSKKLFFATIVFIVGVISFFIIKDSIKKEEPKKVKRNWAAEIPMNVSRKKPYQRDIYLDENGNPFYLEDYRSHLPKSETVARVDTTKKYHATYSKPYTKKAERRYLSLEEFKDSIMMAENNKVSEKRESKSPPEKAFVYPEEVSTWKISALLIVALSIMFFGIGKLMHLWEEKKRKQEYE